MKQKVYIIVRSINEPTCNWSIHAAYLDGVKAKIAWMDLLENVEKKDYELYDMVIQEIIE